MVGRIRALRTFSPIDPMCETFGFSRVSFALATLLGLKSDFETVGVLQNDNILLEGET